MDIEKLKARYGASEHGNFAVVDTIGVPHPYMIGAKHVAHASDHFGGMLGEAAIEDGEKRGIRCAMRGCQLSYKQHEPALLVACKLSLESQQSEGEPRSELHEYLLKCKPLCEEDKYVGFAFMTVGKAK